MKRTVLLTSLCFGAMISHAQYQLDPSFGTNGIVSTEFNNGLADAYEIELLANGKFLVGGFDYGNGPFFGSSFAIAKYNMGGSLDNTFNSTGKLSISFPDISYAYGKSFDVLADGKIILGGSVYDVLNEVWGIALTKINADGTLDNTFGVSGKLITSNSMYNMELNSLAVATDGTIYAAGSMEQVFSDDKELLVMAFNTDGTLKTSFGIDGLFRWNIDNASDVVTAIKIQTDGKLVLTGYSEETLSGNRLTYVIRLNDNGSYDTDFGPVSLGVYWLGPYGEGTSLAIQQDGKILVAGHRETTPYKGYITRLVPFGGLDLTFGTNSTTVIDLGTDVSNYITSIALDSDEKIVFGGKTRNTVNTIYKAMVGRLNTDGSIDGQFNSGQSVFIQETTTHDNDMRSVAALSDGKILIAGCGYTNFTNSTAVFSVARFMEGTSSLSENNLNHLSIFPNPGSGMITLAVNQPTNAVFMSANGAILAHLELNGETSIDVSTYAPGVYFIRTAEGQTVKFIKE